MKCRNYEAQVQEFLDDKLSDEKAEEFILHVKDCKRCYEELEIYFSVYRGIGRIDGEQLMDDDDFHFNGTTYDLNKMLNNVLQDIEKRRVRFQVKVIIGFLAVAVLIALLIILLVEFA